MLPENGGTITLVIQVELLDIWLHKFSVVKIIHMRSIILQLVLLHTKWCSEKGHIMVGVENKFETKSSQNKFNWKNKIFLKDGLCNVQILSIVWFKESLQIDSVTMELMRFSVIHGWKIRLFREFNKEKYILHTFLKRYF